jgi:hypothetical protein
LLQHNHRLAWLRQLAATGLVPMVKILASATRAADLIPLERQWIADLRAQGVRLTNATAGGEGMPDPSEETRIKLRARPPTVTAKSKEKARQLMLARWADPAWRAKMAAVNALHNPPRQITPRPSRPQRLPRRCSYDGCERVISGKTLCLEHYRNRTPNSPSHERGQKRRTLGDAAFAEWKRENARRMVAIRQERRRANSVSGELPA